MFLKLIDQLAQKIFGSAAEVTESDQALLSLREMDQLIHEARLKYEERRERIRTRTRGRLRDLEKQDPKGWMNRMKARKFRIEEKREENLLLESKNLLMKSMLLMKEARVFSRDQDSTPDRARARKHAQDLDRDQALVHDPSSRKKDQAPNRDLDRDRKHAQDRDLGKRS